MDQNNKTIHIQPFGDTLESAINESFERIFEEIDEFEKDLVFYKMSKVSNNKFGGVRGDI